MTTQTNKLQRHQANAAYLKKRTEHQANLADLVIEIKDEDYADKASGLLNGPRLKDCLLYTSPSPRDGLLSRMPSSA